MIGANIGPILVVTGVLTVLVGVGLVLPRQLLFVLLGAKTNDPTTILIGRHWSLLGALVGALLIYAAFHPDTRVPILTVAVIEKLTFGVLVIASPLRSRLLTMSFVCADAAMSLLYVLFLAQYRS